ncbi:NH(3)-dependent NAD(+) synthetase [Defluviimonas aquaemixtae]|uniref:NH(3)-dependent NAD(+) synthetase n=1 Tax=Albidovulum aquaemixtae TaxID=1542388 RepID=A0A2R8B384_9RHOB|nr:NAD(+) synthase [Defluviimonas aquaemixtae]SPH17022.1 NH(3)-dependent NAD(+) synthetase [Defluviimonas aquaemixtae]
MKTEAVIEHITGWLRDYSEKAGTNGFVVGVSGGIDSAVSSTLAARTRLPLLVAEMPIHQGRDQVSRARDHISFLKETYANAESREVELTGVFDRLIGALPDGPDAGAREMALVNTRARLRMTVLYYLAGLHGRLVLGTGNKVEDFGIGFFTKYGDGGVDLSPIADLSKTEVYEVGRALGVNPAILSAAPTDGLWGDDRTDEDQIGASYPELEWAMGFDGDRSALGARQAEVLALYERLNAANRHKMEPIPVCPIPDALR